MGKRQRARAERRAAHRVAGRLDAHERVTFTRTCPRCGEAIEEAIHAPGAPLTEDMRRPLVGFLTSYPGFVCADCDERGHEKWSVETLRILADTTSH